MSRPSRVVSLCPSITETVYALGAWGQLVGRTRYCIHPADLVDGVREIGGTKSPKLEAIRALKPDLILANMEENRREDVEALESEGYRVASWLPKTVSETIDHIRSMAVVLGRPHAGDAVAGEMNEAREACLELPRPLSPLRYAYLIWRNPWMVAGGDTFIDSMLSTVGLQNAMPPGGERYPSVEADDLAMLNPNVVLLSSEPFPFTEKHKDELAESTGLPAERFRFVDGELLSWHGVRTTKGLRYAMMLARVLHENAA